jgi:hypothetical protein
MVPKDNPNTVETNRGNAGAQTKGGRYQRKHSQAEVAEALETPLGKYSLSYLVEKHISE